MDLEVYLLSSPVFLTCIFFAKVDHHRALRCGFPEVVYCAGKTSEQITRIFEACAAHGNNVLGTRIEASSAATLQKALPNVVHDPVSRTVSVSFPSF